MLNSKFMASESDGHLYDTTKPDWFNNPLRVNYRRHYAEIETVAQLKATIRAGEYTFPGGYRLAFITVDGGVLSFDSVKSELFNVVHSIRNDINDGWRVIGCFNVDDTEQPVFCDHSGEQLNEGFENA